MIREPPCLECLSLYRGSRGPRAQVTVVDAAARGQAHGEEVSTGLRADDVLSPVLALGGGQALRELGGRGVHQLVIGTDAEVEGPAVGGLEAADRVGAHD